jgi:HAD superfamily hydrolase (TIGR01549 family)
MAIKSISDFYSYSLYIFDLDNTLYNEEEYLLGAYNAIAGEFSGKFTAIDADTLFRILVTSYGTNGRKRLFDSFLATIGLDESHLPECLRILRTYRPAKKIEPYKEILPVITILADQKKPVFVLTNGNPEQQRNKIGSIDWEGKDRYIQFIFADEIEPKPSPAGIKYILSLSGAREDETLFIGDSDTDRQCAVNSAIEFLHVSQLKNICAERTSQ